MATNLAAQLRLMAVTDDQVLAGRDPVEACLSAERGGATMIQLRLKEVAAHQLAELGRALLQRLRVPLIINDRADVALAVGAAGAHLGPDDVPATLIRRIAPPTFLVGVSVGLDQEIPNGLAGDYWGVGPYRTTTTRSNAGAALGVEGVRSIVQRAGGRPCVAIGGVRPEDVGLLREAGVAGVAVVSGIFREEPEHGARSYQDRGGPIAGAP